jgi:hypothetical protein
MSNNKSLDAPRPGEQPPAKKETKKDTVYGTVKQREDGTLVTTAKAVLVIINGNEQWIPLSQMTVEVDEWLQDPDVMNGIEVPIPVKSFLAKKLLAVEPGQITPEEKKETPKQSPPERKSQSTSPTANHQAHSAPPKGAGTQPSPQMGDTCEAEAVKPQTEKFDEEDAIRNFHSYFPSPADFDAYEKMAGWMIQRNYGIIEGSRKSKEQQQMELELRLMFCKDLNIPPSFALSLYIVNGKPEMQIDLMMYLIARGCPTAEIEPIKYSKEEVSMRARRNRNSPWITATWTIDDAKKNVKGFDRKDVWKNIPAQMLRSRVLGELGRTVFYPELRGLAYVAGEISDNAPVDDKALPTPPREPQKKSFPVKMPAKAEDLPVVPYSTASPAAQAQADQTEDEELNSILAEPNQPEEKAPPKQEDALTLMNRLKEMINENRPKEQIIGLPVVKKGIDRLCKISNKTPAEQAAILLEMELGDIKDLLAIT